LCRSLAYQQNSRVMLPRLFVMCSFTLVRANDLITF
jgi:hypothetical protein